MSDAKVHRKISSAFDVLSKSYDELFSYTVLGQSYRSRVQTIMRRFWAGNKTILELNAGTGEDALFLAALGNHLLATDISPKMIAAARVKMKRSQYKGSIRAQVLSIENISDLGDQRFDGILSNFGGLNCISNIETFIDDARSILKPKGIMILCIMGPWVPWEWLWFSLRGEPRKALRRIKGSAQWRGMKIQYPSIGKVRRIAKKASFQCVYQEALGVLMPPTYVNHLVERHARLFWCIETIEKSISHFTLMNNLSDHFLLVLEKH